MFFLQKFKKMLIVLKTKIFSENLRKKVFSTCPLSRIAEMSSKEKAWLRVTWSLATPLSTSMHPFPFTMPQFYANRKVSMFPPLLGIVINVKWHLWHERTLIKWLYNCVWLDTLQRGWKFARYAWKIGLTEKPAIWPWL